MAGIKSLAKDTAIYGLSSIVGKFLNYFLTPVYTYSIAASAIGVHSNLYAYNALLHLWKNESDGDDTTSIRPVTM